MTYLLPLDTFPSEGLPPRQGVVSRLHLPHRARGTEATAGSRRAPRPKLPPLRHKTTYSQKTKQTLFDQVSRNPRDPLGPPPGPPKPRTPTPGPPAPHGPESEPSDPLDPYCSPSTESSDLGGPDETLHPHCLGTPPTPSRLSRTTPTRFRTPTRVPNHRGGVFPLAPSRTPPLLRRRLRGTRDTECQRNPETEGVETRRTPRYPPGPEGGGDVRRDPPESNVSSLVSKAPPPGTCVTLNWKGAETRLQRRPDVP